MQGIKNPFFGKVKYFGRWRSSEGVTACFYALRACVCGPCFSPISGVERGRWRAPWAGGNRFTSWKRV